MGYPTQRFLEEGRGGGGEGRAAATPVVDNHFLVGLAHVVDK